MLQIASDSSTIGSLHQEEENYNNPKKNKFAAREKDKNNLTEDSSGFKVVPATENEFKDSVIRNEAGQLERMYINAETFAGGDSRFTSYSVTGDLGSSLDGMYGFLRGAKMAYSITLKA